MRSSPKSPFRFELTKTTPLQETAKDPDLPSWSVGFAKTIAAAPGEPVTFTDAVDLVSRFRNPILAGPITGT